MTEQTDFIPQVIRNTHKHNNIKILSTLIVHICSLRKRNHNVNLRDKQEAYLRILLVNDTCQNTPTAGIYRFL